MVNYKIRTYGPQVLVTAHLNMHEEPLSYHEVLELPDQLKELVRELDKTTTVTLA